MIGSFIFMCMNFFSALFTLAIFSQLNLHDEVERKMSVFSVVVFFASALMFSATLWTFIQKILEG